MKKALTLIFFAAAALPSAAVSINVPAIADTTLVGNQTSNNNGGGTQNVLASLGGQRRLLLNFDIVGAIPVGATINSVELVLDISRAGVRHSPSSTASVHRALAAWGEGAGSGISGGSIGRAALGGEATWLSNGTSAWATVGGDFSSTVATSQTLPASGTVTFGSAANFVSDVQFQLDNPSQAHGFFVVPESGTSALRISSREAASGAPFLRVDFTPVPEPSSALLAALGAGLLVRRRR